MTITKYYSIAKATWNYSLIPCKWNISNNLKLINHCLFLIISIQQEKPSPSVSKCNHPCCLICPFLKQGQANYTFTSTKEEWRIHYPLNCKSKNLIYLTERKKCGKQYIGETKRPLHQSFRDHRRSILNRRHFPKKSFSCIRTFQLSRSLYQRSPSPYSLRTNP